MERSCSWIGKRSTKWSVNDPCTTLKYSLSICRIRAVPFVSALAVVGVCLPVSAVSVIRRPVQYPVSGIACTNTKLKSKKSQMQEKSKKCLCSDIYQGEQKCLLFHNHHQVDWALSLIAFVYIMHLGRLECRTWTWQTPLSGD